MRNRKYISSNKNLFIEKRTNQMPPTLKSDAADLQCVLLTDDGNDKYIYVKGKDKIHRRTGY